MKKQIDEKRSTLIIKVTPHVFHVFIFFIFQPILYHMSNTILYNL